MPVRAFFKYLARQNVILFNPAAELELPGLEKTLPKCVLTSAETETVINQPDIATALGLRDRAILETLYSTGMRRFELAALKLYGLDAERGTVMIRLGKGKKDRVVRISERAIAWIYKYLDEARPKLVMESDEGVLFLGSLGEPITPSHLTQVVGNYVRAAEIGKTGSCHLLRHHTAATLMLENGADVRFIQQLLGHVNLTTTEIYIRVSIKALKEVHQRTHPGVGGGPGAGGGGEGDAAAREELLAALEAEAGEEEEELPKR